MGALALAALRAVVKAIGWGWVGFCILYVIDWGIPGAARIAIPKSVPIVGGIGLVDIPLIGDLTTGRVHTYAAEQVRIATVSANELCDGRVEKLVSTSELFAAKSQLAEIERQRNAASLALEDLRKRTAADEINQQLQAEAREQERADYECRLREAGHSDDLTDDDIIFLQRARRQGQGRH